MPRFVIGVHLEIVQSVNVKPMQKSRKPGIGTWIVQFMDSTIKKPTGGGKNSGVNLLEG